MATKGGNSKSDPGGGTGSGNNSLDNKEVKRQNSTHTSDKLDPNSANGSKNPPKPPQSYADVTRDNSGNANSQGSRGNPSRSDQRQTNSVVVHLHAFIIPKLWGIDIENFRHLQVRTSLHQWAMDCAEEVEFFFVETDTLKVLVKMLIPSNCFSLEYKYYIGLHDDDSYNYEYIKVSATASGGYSNRQLNLNTCMSFGGAFHHYDGYIIPHHDKSVLEKITSTFKAFKNATDQRQKGLTSHLKEYSYLAKDLSQLRGSILRIKDTILRIFDNMQQFCLVINWVFSSSTFAFFNLTNTLFEWMHDLVASTVSHNQTLTPKREAEIQALGLLLVAILTSLDDKLLKNFPERYLEDLLQLFKYSNSTSTHLKECSQELKVLLSVDSTELFRLFKKFWLHVSRKIGLHLDILTVLFQLSKRFAAFERLSINQFEIVDLGQLNEISKKYEGSLQKSIQEALPFLEFNPSLSVIILVIATPDVCPESIDFFGLDGLVKAMSDYLNLITGQSYKVRIERLVSWMKAANEKGRDIFETRDVENVTAFGKRIIKYLLPKETVNIVDKQTVLSFALHLADTTIDRMPLFEVIVENITEWICNAATYKESGRKDTFGNGKLISGFTDEFKIWDAVINSGKVLSPPLKCLDQWTLEYNNSLISRLKKLSLKNKVAVFKTLTEQSRNSLENSEILEKITVDAIVASFDETNPETKKFLVEADNKVVMIFNSYMDKKYPNPDSINLEQLLSWHLWSCFIRICISDSQVSKKLSSSKTFLKARNILIHTVQSIYSGSLTPSEANLIREYTSNFQELVSIGSKISTWPKDLPNSEDVLHTFTVLCDQICQFETKKEELQCVADKCIYIMDIEGQRECEELLNLCKTQTDQIPISHLGKILEEYPPVLALENVIKQFFTLFSTFKSGIVEKIWCETVLRKPKILSLQVFASQVWPKFYERLKICIDLLSTFEMKCFEACELVSVGGAAQKSLKRFLQGFSICEENPVEIFWSEEVIHKLQVYSSLEGIAPVAQNFLSAARKFKLLGNFKIVNDIVNYKESIERKPLKIIDEDVAETIAFLSGVNELIPVLSVLSDHERVINWLRDDIKNVKRLQTFIDIALMAHCEDASCVDRLTHLDSVGTKLAPVIFDLPSTSGIKEFMHKCQQISIRKEESLQLIDNLKDCSQSLHWYKEIQMRLGSVETNTFSQIKDLYESGLFCIAAPMNEIPADISELIVVHVAKPDSPVRVFRLEELKDIQSKLALIKGKLQEDDIKNKAEAFWQGMEYIERIACDCLELISVGHIDYRKFKENFYLKDDLSRLRSLALTMETDFETWKTEVENVRSTHYLLNYFTTRQISMMCQELSAKCKGTIPERFEPWFYNLLEIVAPLADHKQVSLAAKEISDRRADSFEECHVEEVDESSTPGHLLTPEDLDEEQKDAYKTLKAVYPPELVLEGLSKIVAEESSEDDFFDQVEDYCMQNADKFIESGSAQIPEELNEEFCEASEEELPINESHPIVSQLSGAGFELEHAIIAVQKCGTDFEKAMDYCMDTETDWKATTSPSTLRTSTNRELNESFAMPIHVQVEEGDLWKLNDVGDFLQVVHRFQNDAIPFANSHLEEKQRCFSCFEPGTPNVIVVPRVDLWRTVLQLYMNPKENPMPSTEEVLVCHCLTTAEDINLLWRRAVGDPTKGKIFCLVVEQNLSYKISKQVTMDLRNITKEHDDYKLVIVCTKEDEPTSLLLGDLREFIKNPPPSLSYGEIHEYLLHHFTQDVVKFGPDLVEVGATVDPERCYSRVITSERAGMGKSLYIQRLLQRFKKQYRYQIVTFHGPDISTDMVVRTLQETKSEQCTQPVVYHLDVSEKVLNHTGSILFSLLILRRLVNSEGNVWHCHLKDLYVIEITVSKHWYENQKATNSSVDLLMLLPRSHCFSPQQCLQATEGLSGTVAVKMDQELWLSDQYQRPYQYLKMYSKRKPGSHCTPVDTYTFASSLPDIPFDNETACFEWIDEVLKYFHLKDPSWSELNNFMKFLDSQLFACENSIYCSSSLFVGERQGVIGFKSFVVSFMVKMSVDFTMPFLVSELEDTDDELEADRDLAGYQIVPRRVWEKSVHPYIFFNRDQIEKDNIHYDSMTFIGFNIIQSGKSVNLINDKGENIENNFISCDLYHWLRHSGVALRQHPHQWNKLHILKVLYRILESNLKLNPDENDEFFKHIDPDPSYALTYDNLVKMLAIQMRFRCGIPVVIMGETGCGKTRLVRYMCQFKANLIKSVSPVESVAIEDQLQTFFILKVHGGISENDIVDFVKKVQSRAIANSSKGLDTVIFFDEANTTDAVGLIKEIMCDRRMRGHPIREGIKFIAACNPYKKHSDSMIHKLESAGLGFYVKMSNTAEKLGSTPLRHLVYRVLDLPASMRPLVYDYGGLNADTEGTYIGRIVENHFEQHPVLSTIGGLDRTVCQVLSRSQQFMKERRDECSYVSLRDVERFMIVFEWFFGMHNHLKKTVLSKTALELPAASLVALILSATVCYSSRLDNKVEYEEMLVNSIPELLELENGYDVLRKLITSVQETFLSCMEMGPNIAHNIALRENLFMMAVCVELRIPLFVVGKPGSSKSLAKSILAESMKGQNSKSDFLKIFKKVKLLSYQCSQLSTPQSIIDVFKSAQNIQDRQEENSISLVVLDEVGLAEDSPSLPLKVLHPLLEDGTDGSDPKEQIIERQNRVAFIGISNWALDPAKMNRGIMVLRGEPDLNELILSALGICSNDESDPIRQYLKPLLELLAKSYLDIVRSQTGEGKEFFGLRDFYSLVKMLYSLVSRKPKQYLNKMELKHAILRNFGGSSDIDPLTVFEDSLNSDIITEVDNRDYEPDCTPLGLIKASLDNKDRSWHGENRYLLFLTENDAALDIMKRYLFQNDKETEPYILFGSSFPKDRDYTQICRNIYQVKICMETGRTIILLNLENLYESLYDLLNQYYTETLDNRYVDLGLQTHRIKCKVDDNFKLILIAEKDKVYEKFPIPLINRLEKHIVTTATILSESDQQDILKMLQIWKDNFTQVESFLHFTPKDAFIGFQSETLAAIVLQATKEAESRIYHFEWKEKIFQMCKELLIQMACPDALARLKSSKLKEEAESIWEIYFEKQNHSSLSDLLLAQLERLEEKELSNGLLIQVTTHSQPLAPIDVFKLSNSLHVNRKNIRDVMLEEIDAESELTDKMRMHMSAMASESGHAFILVQCTSGHLKRDLISCARHKAIDEYENFKRSESYQLYLKSKRQIHFIFIVSLPKVTGGTQFASFQGGNWLSVHIDQLTASDDQALSFYHAMSIPLSELFFKKGIELHKRLKGCIQGAVALSSENPQSDRRKIQVMNILLDAVSNTDDPHDSASFYGTLVKKVHSLLLEQEEKEKEIDCENWALREALKSDSLQEGGTFQNTLNKRINYILTKHFFTIVEYVDRHCNLDLLNNSETREIWLVIFSNDNLCHFNSSSDDFNESPEDLLFNHAPRSLALKCCQFPFSWIFLSSLETQWITMELATTSSEITPGNCFKSLYSKAKATPVGIFLSSVTDLEKISILSKRYLMDFITASLGTLGTSETEVIDKTLSSHSDELLRNEELPSLLDCCVSYHVVYHCNKPHIHHYRELGNIFPDLHKISKDALTEFPHEPLDVQAVQLLLDRISPQPVTDKEFWEIKNLRDNYIRNLRECQSTIDAILSHSSLSTSTVLTEIRIKWQKIRAVQMYIEHLILPFAENESVANGAYRFWLQLDRVKGFNTKSAIEKFLKVLKMVDDGVAKSLGNVTTLREDISKSLSTKSGSQYAQYTQAMQMLFLEVVSVLCFGKVSYSDPESELICFLMDRIFKGDKTQDIAALTWEKGDSVPVVRTVLLQLILSRRYPDQSGLDKVVETFISRGIACLESSNTSEDDVMCQRMSALVVRCMEDVYCKEWPRQSKTVVQMEKLGLLIETEAKTLLTQASEIPQNIQWLKSVAKMRFALGEVADLMNEHLYQSAESELTHKGRLLLEQLIEHISGLLSRKEMKELSLYLAKQLGRRHSLDCLLQLYQDHQFVLPGSLQINLQLENIEKDVFVICGDTYLKIRQAFSQSVIDEGTLELDQVLESTPDKQVHYLLLVFFAKVAWPCETRVYYRNIDSKLVEEILGVCEKQTAFTTDKELLNLASKLLGYERSITQGQAVLPHIQSRTLATLVIHVVLVMLTKRDNLLIRPFLDVLTNPQSLNNKFLPTMPDDFLVKAMQIMDKEGSYIRQKNMRGRFFSCPNGHPYIITECTAPNDGRNCPEPGCGKPIGGVNSQLAEDNYELSRTARKETGHTLGYAKRRNLDAVPERNFSGVELAVTRFLLHVCFYWSASHVSEEHQQSLKEAVTVQPTDLANFFWEHLNADLLTLERALPWDKDQVPYLLHQIINQISQEEERLGVLDCSLVTKEIRNNWEIVFLRVLKPTLQNAESLIEDAMEKLANDNANDDLFLTLYERSNKKPSLSECLWTYRSKITVQHLASALEKEVDAKDNYPLLYRFVHQETVLSALQYLPSVIALQKYLVSAYSHKIDHEETKNIGISKAISQVNEASNDEKASMQCCISMFKHAWRSVKGYLTTHRWAPPEEYIRELESITDSTVLAFFLPSKTGPGVCSLALSDFLCEQHNELIAFTRNNYADLRHRRIPVQLAYIQHYHMISCKDDLEPIILTHCQYSLEYGKGQEIHYNFHAMEKHVYNHFVAGQPIIDKESQPLMVYSSDVIRKSRFKQLEKKVKPQIPLSASEKQWAIEMLHGNLREITDALNMLTIAIGFLTDEGGDPTMLLKDYIRNILKLGKTHFCGKFLLGHVLSMWNTLALERAKKHTLNGKKIPFDGISDKFLVQLETEQKETLTRCFQKLPVSSTTYLLYHFIQFGMRTYDYYEFQWSLQVCLKNYVFECNDNNVRELEDLVDLLPEDIKVAQSIDVWHTLIRCHSPNP